MEQQKPQNNQIVKAATTIPTTRVQPMSKQQQIYLELQQDLTLLDKLNPSEKAVVTIWTGAKKFRQYENADFQQLAFYLLRICADFGREKPPIVQEVINWTIAVGKAYPNLSIEDLKLAFQLAVTGQLSFQLGEHWKTVTLDKFVWETFLTINKVCSGYLEYQRSKMKRYNQELNKRMSEIEAQHQSEKLWKEYVKDWKVSLYEAFQQFKKEGVYTLEDKYCSYFQQLKKTGNLSLTETDIEGIKWIVNQEIDEIVEEKMQSVSGLPLSEIPAYKSKLKKDSYQVKCCTLGIKTQFERWIESGVDVAALIKQVQLIK